MKTTDFIKLEDEIKQILIDDKKARNDDMCLYYKYCFKKFLEKPKELNKCLYAPPIIDTSVFETNISDGLYFHNDGIWGIFIDKEFRKKFNIYTFSAVERTRRKIQAQCPELASDKAKKAREEERKEYKEYSKL